VGTLTADACAENQQGHSVLFGHIENGLEAFPQFDAAVVCGHPHSVCQVLALEALGNKQVVALFIPIRHERYFLFTGQLSICFYGEVVLEERSCGLLVLLGQDRSGFNYAVAAQALLPCMQLNLIELAPSCAPYEPC